MKSDQGDFYVHYTITMMLFTCMCVQGENCPRRLVHPYKMCVSLQESIIDNIIDNEKCKLLHSIFKTGKVIMQYCFITVKESKRNCRKVQI